MSDRSYSHPLEISKVVARLRSHVGVAGPGPKREQAFSSQVDSGGTFSALHEEMSSLNRQIVEESANLETITQDIGTPTPKYASVRGEIAHSVMSALGRGLWWYSWRIKEAFGSLFRTFRIQTQRQAQINDLLIQSIDGLGRHAESIGAVRTQVQQLAGSSGAFTSKLDELRAELYAKQGAVCDSLEKEAAARSRLEMALETTRQKAEELSRYNQYLRSELTVQQARLSLVLREARSAETSPQTTPPARDVDALYVAFEDAFRGSRDEIKKRQAVYLPLFDQHEGLRRLPVLDIGCGRGEWLELLRDHGITSSGVDTNEVMLQQCRDLGLSVAQADGLAYLKDQPASSFGMITAFHVVEHLPIDRVLDLIDQCLRVLAPGGMLILETPNPANVTVGSHHFYMDPTHLRPVPSPLLRFFVEARGFTDVHVRELHPDAEALLLLEGGPVAERFNQAFYGPRDYAVIATKLS